MPSLLLTLTLLIVGFFSVVHTNCSNWIPPRNIADFPKWPYCNRRPGDGETKYQYMVDNIPPADIEPHQCSGTKVLRHDSAGLLCADYKLGDDYAGACTDATCCAEMICSSYVCKESGSTLLPDAASRSCSTFPCNDAFCCVPPAGYPKNHARGIIFVDTDPVRFSYGGTLEILRASDETDITHYRVYWAFFDIVRKVPSCGLKNPVSWTTHKFIDKDWLLTEVEATGCDIKIEIPHGTVPNPRCPINGDRRSRGSAADPCNPTYLFVVAMNEFGERPVVDENSKTLGSPRHPISDYEGIFGLPCAESGVTGGHDLPGPNDVILGKRGQVETAKDCDQLCRDYNRSPPCRTWTWAYNSGGRTEKTCWIESQTLDKTHYGVRILGQSVCPTQIDQPPTGIERPRCDRWIRSPNTAMYAHSSVRDRPRNHYKARGKLDNVWLADRKYDNAEECQAICDQDSLCLGFMWMKKDPTDQWFHKCVIIHHDNGLRFNTGYYDTWMCSRKGMAPLLNGFSMLKNPFGYQTCDGDSNSVNAPDIESCATNCDIDSNCVAFTYTNTENVSSECLIYSTCDTPRKVNKVEGCAFESCYDGFGAVTYLKDAGKLVIVDRWPEWQDESTGGLVISVETNKILAEGSEVVCVASRVGLPNRPVLPTKASLMKSLSYFETAPVTSGVAKMILTKESVNGLSGLPEIFVPGSQYLIQCAAESYQTFDLPESTNMKISTSGPSGYRLLGNGYCRSSHRCPQYGYILDLSKRPWLFTDCQGTCDNDDSCVGFWFDHRSGHCHIKSSNNGGCTSYTHVNRQNGIQCYVRQKDSGTSVHSVGNDICGAECEGTCAFARQLGVYDRNYFIPLRALPGSSGSSFKSGENTQNEDGENEDMGSENELIDSEEEKEDTTESSNASIPGWGIGLIVLGSVSIVVIILVALFLYVGKSNQSSESF